MTCFVPCRPSLRLSLPLLVHAVLWWQPDAELFNSNNRWTLQTQSTEWSAIDPMGSELTMGFLPSLRDVVGLSCQSFDGNEWKFYKLLSIHIFFLHFDVKISFVATVPLHHSLISLSTLMQHNLNCQPCTLSSLLTLHFQLIHIAMLVPGNCECKYRTSHFYLFPSIY